MKNTNDKTEAQINYVENFLLVNRSVMTDREIQALSRCERSTGFIL